VHEHHVGPFRLEYRIEPGNYRSTQTVKGLPWRHDRKVMVWRERKQAQYIIKHLPMLPRDAQAKLKILCVT